MANSTIRFVVEGIGIPSFGIIGVVGSNSSKLVRVSTETENYPLSNHLYILNVGNLLSLGILFGRNLQLKSIYKQLITSLLIWDVVFISLAFLLFSFPHFNTDYQNRWMCQILYLTKTYPGEECFLIWSHVSTLSPSWSSTVPSTPPWPWPGRDTPAATTLTSIKNHVPCLILKASSLKP